MSRVGHLYQRFEYGDYDEPDYVVVLRCVGQDEARDEDGKQTRFQYVFEEVERREVGPEAYGQRNGWL